MVLCRVLLFPPLLSLSPPSFFLFSRTPSLTLPLPSHSLLHTTFLTSLPSSHPSLLHVPPSLTPSLPHIPPFLTSLPPSHPSLPHTPSLSQAGRPARRVWWFSGEQSWARSRTGGSARTGRGNKQRPSLSGAETGEREWVTESKRKGGGRREERGREGEGGKGGEREVGRWCLCVYKCGGR